MLFIFTESSSKSTDKEAKIIRKGSNLKFKF